MSVEDHNKIMKRLLKNRVYPFNTINIRGKFRVDKIKSISEPPYYFRHVVDVTVDAEWYTIAGFWHKPIEGRRRGKKLANQIVRREVEKIMVSELIMVGSEKPQATMTVNVKWKDIN